VILNPCDRDAVECAAPSARAGERGVVLIWAATCMLIVAGVIAMATDKLHAVDVMAGADFSASGQAEEIAEAGLVDAFAWFRRQTVQPVTAFAPKRDLLAVPAINETDDPTKGLVRSFEISAPSLWGRYTVRVGNPNESWTDANGNGHYDVGETFADSNADGRWTAARETRDITTQRGLTGPGSVWLLVSHAQVFWRPRADLALGEGPNRQLAESTLAREVRRLTIAPPAAAALCCSRADLGTIGNRGRIRAATTGVAFPLLTGLLNQLAGGEILAATQSVGLLGWADTVNDVFGVGLTDLKSMADISTSDPVNGIPDDLPDYSLLVITGNPVFDAARPLKGTGVIVVKGDLTILDSSNSFFSGLIYVDGNLTVRAPALIRGTVIVRGTCDIRGTGGDYVEIEHDPAIVATLLTKMGQYRHTKSTFSPSPQMADGRPDESR
jgi:hypothetical protein